MNPKSIFRTKLGLILFGFLSFAQARADGDGNDSRDQAEITTENGAVIGSVTFGNDPIDWYKFELTQDGSFRLNVEVIAPSLPNGIAMYVSLTNSSTPGWLIGDETVNNNSNRTWDMGYRGKGWYYIRLWAIQPTAGAVEYTVNLESDHIGVDDDPLPNETAEESELIALDQVVGGHIDFVSAFGILDQIDMYRIQVPEPMGLVVHATFGTTMFESNAIHPVVLLYDSLGINAGASFFGGYTDSVTLYQADLQPGTYYITIAIQGSGQEGPGCGYQLVARSDVTTGFELLEFTSGPIAYPNPSHGVVQVAVPAGLVGGVLTVFDLKGQIVVNGLSIANGTVVLPSLPVGRTYLVRMNKGVLSEALRIVVD